MALTRLKRHLALATIFLVFLSTFYAFLSYRDPALATDKDVFGTEEIYPTRTGGHVWNAKWDSHPRTFYSGDTDPRDPMFHNRGSGTKFTVNGDGTATTSGNIMRYYVHDRSGGQEWGDVEMTFYAKRVKEQPDAPSKTGFTVEVRTGDGHNDNNSCDGYAYAATMRYWGAVRLGKEIVHPDLADTGGPGGKNLDEVPKDQWVGFKLVVRDVGPNAVKLELYRDMTDGKNGGDWQLLLEYTDDGGWYSSKYPNGVCGRDADHVITGMHPIVLLRNDESTMELKKFSVREIVAPDSYIFKDIGSSIFRNDIEWLATTGITKGCNPPRDDLFCTGQKVTRGQMASFLARALNLPKADRDYFSDDSGSVHEANINALAAAGITKGCGSGKYCPSDLMTREQFAVFMVRALDLPEGNRDYFKDDDNSPFEAYINSLARSGITKGYSNTEFGPRDAVTRGQMAAFLHRAFG